jgi:hypothetical protein
MRDIDNPRYKDWSPADFCPEHSKNAGNFHYGERRCHGCGITKKKRKVSPDAASTMEIRTDQSDWVEHEWGSRVEPGAEHEVIPGLTLKNTLGGPIWLGRIVFKLGRRTTP